MSVQKDGSLKPPRPSRVQPVSLAVLASRADAQIMGSTSAEVTGVTLHAQHVRPGDLFAALPGARVHGADFAEAAIAAGAAAVLTDEAGASRPVLRAAGIPLLVHSNPRSVLGGLSSWIYGEPSRKLAILGITGTSGKTTTAYMVEAGLRAAGRTTGLIGTVETRVAGERIASALTTPEAPDLQALFSIMVERGITHVTMEVSSHSLVRGRVSGTHFALGAFTNLSQDHLDFHHDMDEYFAAKAQLFDGRADTEVVVIDSDWGAKLLTPDTITVATKPGTAAMWTASELGASSTGEQSFRLHGPKDASAKVTLPLPGVFNVANALLAAAMLDATGVSLEQIVTGLSAVAVPGRMERVYLGQDFTAVVDFAHKPAAVVLALDALRARTDGRLITVLGCGGDRDTAKRPMMGEAAAQRSDVLIVTDDNPRSEDPAVIRAEMLAGARMASTPGEILEIGDRREAIQAAVTRAKSGDVVVIAGKGHERGQEVHGVVRPFSDREELTAAIQTYLGVNASASVPTSSKNPEVTT